MRQVDPLAHHSGLSEPSENVLLGVKYQSNAPRKTLEKIRLDAMIWKP